MTVHPEAEAGFHTARDAYHRGRPEYPDEIGAWMREVLHLPAGSALVELGAGTGKFTKSLLADGFALTAVEPVTGMRELLLRDYPAAMVQNGTAEATGLPEASADAVVAAQAFHWFSSEATLQECARILKPDGALILLWNIRDDQVDWVRAFDQRIDAHAGGTPRFKNGEWRAPFAASDLFTPLQQVQFSHVQTVTAEKMLDRAVSTSFIATLPAAEKAQLVADIRALLATHPDISGHTEFPLPYRTEVFYCRKK